MGTNDAHAHTNMHKKYAGQTSSAISCIAPALVRACLYAHATLVCVTRDAPKKMTFHTTTHSFGRGSKPSVPFWGRCTPILVYFGGDWDVHWGHDLDFDSWPFGLDDSRLDKWRGTQAALGQPPKLAEDHGESLSRQTRATPKNLLAFLFTRGIPR